MELSSSKSQASLPVLTPWLVLSIILIEGFITISVEILTIRQLVPFVGNNVTVTSIIIGIFLLFLAYGYKRGGKQETDFAEKLNQNFTISAIILGIGLSYIFIELFFLYSAKLLGFHLLLILTLYLLLITAPLVYLLGQTVPITMNLIKKQATIGSVGGKVLHVSTVGSFLGAVLTTLLFIHFFGVALTVMINYLCLLILIAILTLTLSLRWLKLILLAGASVIFYKLNVEFEHLAFVETNNYANYRVQETDKFYGTRGKILNINNTAASYTNEQLQGFPYIEKIKNILYQDLKMRGKQILVLGAGGFTLSQGNTYNNYFTYVDIDSQLASIVKKHFLKQLKGKIIDKDARVFVKHTKSKYDVIISDVYNNPAAIPSHLTTQEYFQSIYNILTHNGVGIFNLIIHPTLETRYSKRLDNTIRSVFKNCMSLPLEYTKAPTNVLYICYKAPNENDTTLYTDNLNKSEIDMPLPH